MISIQSRLVILLLRIIKKKTFFRFRFLHKKIDLFNISEPTKKITASFQVVRKKVNDHNVFIINPPRCEKRRHILYLHGGAYIEGFVRPHWDFIYFLIRNLGYTVIAPDYPLAPAFTHKEAFSMVSAIYKDLIKKIDPDDLIIMGDSSGGGFALALAQLMKTENMPQPRQIILLSPWLDIGLSNPAIREIDPSDYFLGIEGLKEAGRLYAGDTGTDNFLVSPIYGPLNGLGEISVFIGSREILVADTRKLKALTEEQGVKINYFEYPGMFHAWMLLNLPESKKAKNQILELIRKEIH